MYDIYLITNITIYLNICMYIYTYISLYNSPIDIDIINVCSAQAVEEDEQTNDAGKDQHLELYIIYVLNMPIKSLKLRNNVTTWL